jgi:hypothetical protein
VIGTKGGVENIVVFDGNTGITGTQPFADATYGWSLAAADYQVAGGLTDVVASGSGSTTLTIDIEGFTAPFNYLFSGESIKVYYRPSDVAGPATSSVTWTYAQLSAVGAGNPVQRTPTINQYRTYLLYAFIVTADGEELPITFNNTWSTTNGYTLQP